MEPNSPSPDRLSASQTLRLGPPHERGSVTPLIPPATVLHPHQHAADAPSPGGDDWEDRGMLSGVKEYILFRDCLFDNEHFEWIGV